MGFIHYNNRGLFLILGQFCQGLLQLAFSIATIEAGLIVQFMQGFPVEVARGVRRVREIEHPEVI